MSLFTEDDVEDFRTDRLVRLLASYAPGEEPSDAYILDQLKVAEASVARQLRIFLEPTTVFPHPPSQTETDALPDGMPWVETPANDYDPEFFRGERWGFIVVSHHPVISVESIHFTYPSPASLNFFTIPTDWIRLDKRMGHIRLVPVSASISAPLNIFLMQAMSGGQTIPGMIQVKYVAGLKDARADYPDLIDVIKKTAALNILENLFLPSSGSISGDGLSQSISLKMEDYRDIIDRKLFGPKGSNGGLWTAIHGITMGILGTTA